MLVNWTAVRSSKSNLSLLMVVESLILTAAPSSTRLCDVVAKITHFDGSPCTVSKAGMLGGRQKWKDMSRMLFDDTNDQR